MHTYYVYIISNTYRTTFYIGVTNDIYRRMYEHRFHVNDGFSARYFLHDLVYYEATDDISAAIHREKQLKNWHRPWKHNLIRSMNPLMEDLAADWFEDFSPMDCDPETDERKDELE